MSLVIIYAAETSTLIQKIKVLKRFDCKMLRVMAGVRLEDRLTNEGLLRDVEN